MILTDCREPDVVALNYRHPIARGLDYFVNHGLVEKDLANTKKAITIPSGYNVTKEIPGFGRRVPAHAAASATMNMATPGTASSNGTYTGDYSLAAYIVFNTLGYASNQNLFGQTNPNGSFPDTGLAINTSNQIILFRDGTSSGGSTAIPAVGVPVLIAGTRASGTITSFMNGYPGSTASISSAMGDANARVYYGQYPTSAWVAAAGGFTGDVTFLWSAWWRRALTRREIANLAADPWQLIRVTDDPIGRAPVAATFQAAWARNTNSVLGTGIR